MSLNVKCVWFFAVCISATAIALLYRSEPGFITGLSATLGCMNYCIIKRRIKKGV